MTGLDRERFSNQSAAAKHVARSIHDVELLGRALVEHDLAHGSKAS